MIAVESDQLPPDSPVAIIPLLFDYPSVRLPNPIIRLDVVEFIYATAEFCNNAVWTLFR
ncbi:hypothetical protein [Meridianimarinicoccus aquatilis]|uniref:hypothetical protein n=1 Tax=Meridianimarinicoccus aquatilis TaxID=2552766 RepID=UPI00140543E7|nr:hypothetical protein [Fluviibacterium aquatile]